MVNLTPPSAEVPRPLERGFLCALYLVGFALRWLFADGDFFGDEAWYFYLARTFGSEAAAAGEHPVFHVLNRPLFYAFYHLSTYGGLVGFRFAGCLIGAAVPLLNFVTARRFGASPLWAAVAACFLCVQRQQLSYSAHVFPDVLAAAFALAACQAAAARQTRSVFAWSLACVWTKESFVLLPAIGVALGLLAQRSACEHMRLDRWQWSALIIGPLYVATLTAYGKWADFAMQGWSSTPFRLAEARNMTLGVEVWPWLVWLAVQRQGRILLLWLGLPAFYLLWNRVLGRGIAPWYVVGPAALASVAVALTGDRLIQRARARQLPAAAQWGLAALFALCCARPPAHGLVHASAQLSRVQGLPWPSAAPEVRAQIAKHSPQRVLLIDCFWADAFSHLRGVEPASPAWWEGPQSSAELLARALQSDFVVICRKPEREALERSLRAAPFEVAFEDPRWLALLRRR